MKKLILLFAVLGIALVPAKATHLMGSQIVSTHISGYTYQIKLTTYRDTLGIPMATSADFHINGIGNAFNTTISTGQDANSGNLMPLYPYGVEIYYFTDTVTFPDTGTYEITWSNCCRNHAILNMTTPGSEELFLRNVITVTDSSTPNSSPLFLVPPVVFLPIHTPWAYNPLPFDPDGDSLAWSIVTPLSSGGSLTAGYTLPASDTTGPYSIDPITGTISWTASTIGNWDAAVLIEEFRNGVKIGETRRDMQYIVVQSQNHIASFTNTETLPTNDRGYYEATIPVGTNFSFQLTAEDPDLQDDLSLEAYGAPLSWSSSPATFYFNANGGNNKVIGTFQWTPDISALRNDPYITVFRASDGTFSFDLAILLRVVNSTGITDINNPDLLGGVFPNPSNGTFTMPVTLEGATGFGYQIFDLSGRMVYTSDVNTMNAGVNMIQHNTPLNSGAYIIRAFTEDGAQSVNKLIVE